jgi:PAS domain S-box-containing protein
VKLRNKFLAALWTLLALSTLGFGAIGVRFLRFQMEGEMHGKSLTLSRAFVIVAEDALRGGRPKDASDFLAALKVFPDVEEARLLDPRGRTLAAHSRDGWPMPFQPNPKYLAAALSSVAPVIKTESRGGVLSKVVYQRVESERPRAEILGVCYLRLTYGRIGDAVLQMLRYFLPIILAWAAILSLLAVFFSRRITRPLEEVRAAAMEVGKGRWDLKLPLTGGGEFTDLAAAFNLMVHTLSRTTVSKEYFTTLVDASPLAIIAIDLAGNVTIWNRAAEILFGWTTAEILGRPYPIIPDDQPEAFQFMLKATAAGRSVTIHEAVRRRKGGSTVAVSVSAACLRGADGRVTGGVALISDLTQRRRLEARFNQVEKLSAVGRLAAGVAHELNNPLGVILAFSQSLRRTVAEKDPLAFPLESIERETRRCGDLVANLLTYARAAKPEDRGPVDLNEAVSEALALIDTRARGQETAVHREFAEELPPLHANKNQLQQIVFNLCYNALDALERNGRLTVRTALVTEEGREWAVLEVSDDGPGMTADVQKSIFEPFFTTKEMGKGTGLGLSLVHEIVVRHGGGIEVTSSPGAGAAFAVRLPRAPLDDRA